MDARFEDDLIEIAGDDNYLILCSDRRMLFLSGAVACKLAFEEVTGFVAEGDAILVRCADGRGLLQPFPSAAAGFVQDAAAKLSAALAA
jgi:hypothetical protein